MSRLIPWKPGPNPSRIDIFLSILSNFNIKRQSIMIPSTDSLKPIIWDSPIISKNQIQEVKARLNKGMQYPEALSGIRQLFKYDTNILLSLVNFFQDGGQKEKDSNINYSIIPLSYAIFWLSCPDLSCVDHTEYGQNVDLTAEYELLIQVILLMFNKMEPMYYYFILDSISVHFFRYGNNKKYPFEIIPTIFERPDPYLFDVASSILSYLAKEKQIDQLHKLIDILYNNVLRYSSKYVDCNMELLINTLLPFFTQFDISTLKLFSGLATLRVDPQLKDIFFDIPQIYISKINLESQNYPISIDTILEFEHVKVEPSGGGQSGENKEHRNLPSDLNPPPISDFQIQKEFEDFFQKSELNAIQFLPDLLNSTLPEYVESFLDGFISILKNTEKINYSIQSFISFIYMADKIPAFELKNEMFDIITNKLIFMPSVSIFYKNEIFDILKSKDMPMDKIEYGFELITFLRKSVLFILAKRAPNFIGTLLQNIENHSFLFADVIGRIHVNLEKFDLNYLTNEMSLGAVVHAINNLSILSDNCDDETLKKVSQARSTILIFLISILENSSVAVRCFSSSIFTHGFLAEIFDPSFQKPISIILKQFLTKSKGDVSKIITPTLDFICRIIDVCASSKDDDNHDSVAYDLLLIVNDFILHNRLPLNFEPLIISSTHYLAVRPSVKFLDQTLQLYSQMLLTSTHYSVSNAQIQHLSVAIRRSDGIKPSDATVCCIFGMMARSRSDNVNSSFFVKEPKISILLFSIIQTKEDTLKYIKLFLELCQYSSFNCIQFHKGEFDLLLLSFLKNYPNSFTFRGCQFDLIISKEDVIKYVFPILLLIASFDSSPQVCAGLFSLMAPSVYNSNDEPDNFRIEFPEFSSNFINQLSGAITKLSQDPKVVLQLGLSDRIINVEGLKSQVLENGFTFQFFLFVDVHSAKISKLRPLILKITDDEDAEILFYIQGSSIVCCVNSLFGVLSTNIPSCTWVRLSLILQHFDNISTISFALNNSIQTTFNLNFPPFADKNINFQIGGVIDPSIYSEAEGDSQIETLAYIGAFRFFNEPLSKSKLSDLNELGSRKYSSDTLDSLFLYPPLEDSPCNYKIEKRGRDFPYYENLIDTLKKPHALSLIVPFFLYSENMPPHFFGVFLDILLNIVENEKQFPFFPVIGQILTNKPNFQLNYSLYLKFLAFAENDDQSLVKSLILHILMNLELWSNTESSQFIRILSHWNLTLYPSFHNIIDECYTFSGLLANARIYLWYKPIEVELIRGAPGSLRPRDENLDIEACRSNYNKFLLAFASANPKKITSKDAQTIISHCASCQDHQQVFSLLRLFMNIINNFKKLKLKIPEASSRLLYLQFKPHHEERFLTAYKLLYSLTPTNELHKYTEVIISLMNKMFFTETLFNECSTLITKEGCPCSYPLCIFIAMNLERKYCVKMAHILSEMPVTTELAELFKCDEKWCAWPLALLYELIKPQTQMQNLSIAADNFDSCSSSDSVGSNDTGLKEKSSSKDSFICDDKNDPRLEVLNFLLNVLYADFSFDALDLLMNTFDLFSFIFGCEFEEYSRILMVKIANHFKDSENRDFKPGILPRCIKMLTLRVNDPPTMGLMDTYINSPFCDPILSLNSARNSENPNQIKSLENIINNLTEKFKNSTTYSSVNKDNIPNFYKFGLVIDNKNQPLFNDLYQITKLYLINNESSNIAISFWNQTYEVFLNKKERTNRDINNYSKIFDTYSINVTFGNNKRNNNIYKSIMKSIEENDLESKSVIESPDPNEISIALNDIFNNSLFYQSARDLKKLFRLSMQEDSFWNDSRFRLSAYSKSFISDSSYSQPFLKKVFANSNTFFKSQFISKSSSLIFASANNCNQRNKSNIPINQNLQKGAFLCKQIKFTKEIEIIFKFSSKGDHLKIIKSTSSQRINFSDIKRIFIRWRFLRPNSLEFYLKDGVSLLIDFTPIDAQTILSHFSSINPQLVQTVSSQEFFDNTDYMKQWTEGNLTNFDYLMILNIFAGRTFNEPTMYPIFPWILSSYNDPKEVQYRNLSLPIAAQNKEQNLIYLIAPSTPMLLSYFLNRVEPFSLISPKLKIKKLQLADHPFNSMQTAYNEASSKTVKNCWELTPEFYSAPHFFGEKLKSKNEIGNSESENHFELPSWASSEEEFIYLHRKQLESPKVSRYLNQWIDLIFGNASRGMKAAKHENVFNDVIFSPIFNKEDQAELEKDLRIIGQLPAQLFKKPHPSKKIFKRTQMFQPPAPSPLNILKNKQANDDNENFGLISATIIDSDYLTITSLCYCSDGTVHKVRTDFVVSVNCLTTKIGRIKTGSGIDLSFNTVSDTTISPVFTILSSQQVQLQQQEPIISSANLNSSYPMLKTGNAPLIPLYGSSSSSLAISLETRPNNGDELANNDNETFDNSSQTSKTPNSISTSFSTPLPSPPALFTLPTLVVNNSNELVICSILNGFIVVDNKKLVVHVAKDRKIEKFKNLITKPVICMTSSNHLIAATSINGEVFGWDDRNFDEKLFFCCVTSDIVTSLAINEKFGIVACGTSSGELCVYSFHTHMLMFIVKLPAEPSRIIITPEWGFIVAESSHELFLISITGKVIRRKSVDFVIAKWISWSCERGIDFIVIADTKGQIRMSEAFYIKFDEIIFQSKTKILDMKYILLSRGIALISADGYARLLPKGLPE